VTLAFEATGAGVFGVDRSIFTKRLTDEGKALGVRFRPGGFHPFYGRSIAALNDRVVPARQVFGQPADDACAAVMSPDADDAAMVAAAAGLLRGCCPVPDPVAEQVAGMAERIAKAAQDFDAGLSDDLNTAIALAAVYDLVREANTAMDKGEFRQGDASAAQDLLAAFDHVFAVIADSDAEKLQALGYGDASGALTDTEVEKLVAERQDARKRRDFAGSDRIRKELADRGIILEDSRDGTVRWKRK